MYNIKDKNLKQSGGECLGAGTYGCVLKPPISCRNNSKKSKYTDTNTNTHIISKISTYDTHNLNILNDIYEEINMGSKIYKLDDKCRYLCPIIKYCKIKPEDVKTRDDIKFKNLSDMEDIDLDYNSQEYQKKCIFNINKNFITMNLIGHYAGQDLDIFLKQKSNNKYYSLIKNNFKYIIKDLLNGLQLLHNNKITHKDIKLNNICILIKNNIPLVRYIDFGLSEDLNELKQSFSNIFNSGTPSYMAPDFIILVEMKKLKFKNLINKRSLHNNIINKLFNSIKSNLSTFTNKGLNKTFLNGNLDTLDSYLYIDNNNNNFINKNDISNIFLFLLNLYKKDELLNFYFKPSLGLNPKFDIFSLGLVIFELKKKLKIKDILLVNLLKNMLSANSINRLSIGECIEHFYIDK